MLKVTHAHGDLPNKFHVILCSNNIPEHSSKWVEKDNSAPELVNFSQYGTKYYGKTYKVLSKLEKEISPEIYVPRAMSGLISILPTFGMTSFEFEDTGDLFRKNYEKVYLGLYDSGKGPHEISQLITKKMTILEFSKTYNHYSRQYDSPGVVNGVFEKSLSVGNIPLIKLLVETLGNNFLNKRTVLSDMIVASVHLLHEKKLSIKKTQKIVQELINQGASLNEISKISELNFHKVECKSHIPKTVLDAIYCEYKDLSDNDWHRIQKVVNLIISEGGRASPGKYCCKIKFINTKIKKDSIIN